MIIVISSKPGGGSSSVGRALAKKINYNYYSIGDIRRRIARDKGLTLEQLNKLSENDSSSDVTADSYTKKLAEHEDNLVIDALMGFYFIPGSVKIFLDADPKMRAKRIYERGKFEEQPEDIKHAIKLLKERERNDSLRFNKLYGVDPYDCNHFDLVLDTTNNSVMQTVDEVYRFIASRLKN